MTDNEKETEYQAQLKALAEKLFGDPPERWTGEVSNDKPPVNDDPDRLWK